MFEFCKRNGIQRRRIRAEVGRILSQERSEERKSISQRRLTALQNCLYQPHVSHAFHSSISQLARFSQASSEMTARALGLACGSDFGGARQATKPSRVLDSAAFCSLVKLENALRAVLRAGFSMAGTVSFSLGSASRSSTSKKNKILVFKYGWKERAYLLAQHRLP